MSRVVRDPGKAGELKSSHFGENTDEGLLLEDVEEAYLVEQGKLDGDLEQVMGSGGEGFEARYLVYRDFRSRGFYLKPGGAAADFLVYPRGKGPGEAAAKFLVYALSERQGLPLAKVRRWTREASNLQRSSICSLVDEEGDITHYRVSRRRLKGTEEPLGFECSGTLLGDRVVTRETRLHEEEFYGQPLGDLVQLSLVEAHFLVEEGRLDLGVEESELVKRARAVEDDFDEKSRLYRELREDGVVPKTGFKFGSHFRTYSYFESLDDFPHAENLVHALPPEHVFEPPELSRAVRLAHSVKKDMLFASMGENIEYFHFERTRP